MGEFEHCFHRDFNAMPLEGLYREARRVQLRLDFDDKPTAWMLERLQALRYIITLRYRASSQERSFRQAMSQGETLRTVNAEALPPWH